MSSMKFMEKLLDGVVKKKRVVTLPFYAYPLIWGYKLTPSIAIKVSGMFAKRAIKSSQKLKK